MSETNIYTVTITKWDPARKGFRGIGKVQNLSNDDAVELMGILGGKDTGYMASITPAIEKKVNDNE